MRHLAALINGVRSRARSCPPLLFPLIIALMLALPSAALADPQAYNGAGDDRASSHVRDARDDGPRAAADYGQDDEGIWMNFRGWIVRWLPIILGQDRPVDADQ